MRPKARIVAATLTFVFASSPLWADDSARRSQLKSFAVERFSTLDSDCEAFAQVAERAASSAPDVATWMEDMRLVIIGEDWRRRADRRGSAWYGVKTDASGFKPDLKDDSPQSEHAMAAIYLGKGLPPALAGVGGTVLELKALFEPGSVNSADVLLWLIGGDIGERLSAGNLKQIGTPIRRTMCS